MYIGDIRSQHYGTYIQTARELADIPFLHIDSLTYDEAELSLLGLKALYHKKDLFALRVYRRGNLKDFLEYKP